ncbi:MAG: LysR family transcriptional regulator [Pseudomonadota bacterium]
MQSNGHGTVNSRQLELFSLVCSAGSLSKASLNLGMTQPALSKHVRDLECELGVQLLHRNGRGVSPTPDGDRLLQHADAILTRMREAKEEALRSRDAPAENLTIGVTPTIGRMLIGPLSNRLVEAFPDIRLRFVEGFSIHLLEGLTEGKLDIALLYDSGAASRLRAEPLLKERLHYVSAASANAMPPRITLAQVLKRPLILPGTPYGLRPLVADAAADIGSRLDARIEVDGFGAMLDLVISGLGSTIVPGAVVRREVQAGDLQISEIVEPELFRTVVLAIGINRVRMKGLSKIVSMVREETKNVYEERLPTGPARLAVAV